ncbi:carbohydrate kinase family protein [Pelosinus sp. sgz500959]|uniref:carbohydrate kinase family protein n=1 Tax=Pelosinus sp. sgz500959 TaxID=3242472 RepID=UPI00366E51E7
MKFGIVGPISKDRIVWPNGEILCKFGAIHYTAQVLAKLVEGTEDVVICLSHVSSEDRLQVKEFLNHPNINMVGINISNTTGTRIDLTYVDEHERTSCQTQVMEPISAEELSLLSECDYVILMPLNETDIPLSQLEQFRSKTKATIFLDVHGLVTGVNEAGKRYRKNWICSDEWLNHIDILKMNDKEASWASGQLLREFTDYLQYALSIVKRGLVACWITFGDQSSLVAWQRQDKIFWATVPVTDVGRVVDTIGCGDSASAGFIYAYAKIHSPLIAVVLGNMLGSVKASICETNDFPTKPEVRSMIYEHYRDYFHNLLDEFLSQQHLIVNEVKEDFLHESFMHSTNGYRYNHGADNESHSNSQGSATPGS